MNELGEETSPYLRQHADNPVHWLPWGARALTRARAEGKPILLSIGYSACHWCHVMAHESFEDAETAAIMNELFVNVKVDREERPDLDQIYQTAHRLLSRRNGGWPLTMFLAPDGRPFYSGTYFPPRARHGLPAFRDILAALSRAFREHRDDVERQGDAVVEALARLERHTGIAESLPETDLPARAVRELAGSFDPECGGFGGAPKFPHPYELDLCLRRAAVGDATALDMAGATLARMAEGGLFDHVGGGFFRYSVDREWAIPHFEKMLYDNAALLALYADAWRLTGEAVFARVVDETAAFVAERMRASEGGFFSSLDADSEGEEGRYYVWSLDELEAALDADEFVLAQAVFGLDGPPNFEGHSWHLVRATDADVRARLGIDVPTLTARLAALRVKLARLRAHRVPPGLDDKILTAWNALAIRALARAGMAFRRTDWIEHAQRGIDYLRGHLWREGRLLATAQGGRARLNAYLDDHAFLLDALLESLQAGFRREDLEFARELADALLERFEDRDGGGMFFTSHDHEALIARPKTGIDNVTPSGNGIAASSLLRFGHLCGISRYIDAGERILRHFADRMQERPSAHPSLLAALELAHVPPTVVILKGNPAGTAAWLDELLPAYAPYTLVVAIPQGLAGLPDALTRPDTGDVNAWVCRGVNCLPSMTDLDKLRAVCQFGEVVT